MARATPRRIDVDSGAPSLLGLCSEFVTKPYATVVKRWNWKSALMSSLVRGAIFFLVNLTAGAAAAWAAFLTEFAFRACTAGFYGAITQNLSRVRPSWQGTVGALVLLPLANHSAEFFVHWLNGTAKLEASIFASVCFTALSSTFHVFVMRRGLLVVGEGSGSLLGDLKQMPRVVVLFLATPFVWGYTMLTTTGARAEADRVSDI